MTVIMTVQDLIDKLHRGEIIVNPDQLALFAGYGPPMHDLFKSLERFIENYGNFGLTVWDDGIIHSAKPGLDFRHKGQMHEDSLSLTLDGNVLTFMQIESIEFGRKPGIIYCEAKVDPEHLGPSINTIQIPSGEIAFTNFFLQEINPNPENMHEGDFNLCTIAGRHNLARYYAEKNNVGQGQTGNMDVCVFSNGSKILITDSRLAHEGEFESFGFYDDAEHDEYREADKIIHPEFTLMGKISCEMWRYEFTDGGSLDAREYTPLQGQNQIACRFAIPGTKVRHSHSYGLLRGERRSHHCIMAELEVLP